MKQLPEEVRVLKSLTQLSFANNEISVVRFTLLSSPYSSSRPCCLPLICSFGSNGYFSNGYFPNGYFA